MVHSDDLAKLVLSIVVAYLYGAIPFAYLAVRLSTGKRLTEEGTGNVGVTNAWRAGRVPAVVLTLLGEISKAFVAVGLAEYVFPGALYAKALLILTAFAGTNWSIYMKWKGGRGTTMLIWSLALLSLPALLVLIGIGALCFFLAKKSPGLRTLWSWFIPVVILLVEADWVLALFGLVVSVLVFVKGRTSEHDAAYYVSSQGNNTEEGP